VKLTRSLHKLCLLNRPGEPIGAYERSRSNELFAAVLLVEGVVAGFWREVKVPKKNPPRSVKMQTRDCMRLCPACPRATP
jgi:hypothetical protein